MLQRHSASGMTILELLLVMGVIGLLMMVGYSLIRDVRQTSLREDATDIAAVLRATYNFTTQTGKHHRVVFDLSEQTYRIEVCEGAVAVQRAEDEEVAAETPEDPEDVETLEDLASRGVLPKSMLEAMDPEKATRVAAALTGKAVGGSQCALSDLWAGDSRGRGNVRKLRADKGIRLRRVHVEHLEEPVIDGVVTLNYFPLGYTEKAILEVANDDGHQYSLLVHGLTGRVELRDGELRDPDDFMNLDALGEREEAQ